MSRRNLRLLLVLLVLAFLAAAELHFLLKKRLPVKESAPAQTDIAVLESQSVTQAIKGAKPATLPAELNLKMTFYPQAPYGDWSLPWQESCEEASTLLVANVYFNHNWSRENFKNQILKMIDWENVTFGTYLDSNASQIAQILNDYLGLKTIIHDDPTYDEIKQILNKGHLIIAPFAGQMLHNPYFSGAGPIYHALVIKGYKEDQKIVTEDVGTRQGEDYVYSWSVLENALHEFAKPIESGAKKIIEVLPPTK